MKELKGKTAVVTCSGAVGRAICFALADMGADIAVLGPEGYSMVAGAVSAGMEVRTCAVQVDPRDREAVAKSADYVIETLGPACILVNAAYATQDRTIVKMTSQQWDEVIAANLTGPFNIVKAFLPAMLDSGWGRIINLSSIVGQWGNYGQSNYAAAKAGVIGFTQTLAREMARKNITANVVSPGFIESEDTDPLPDAVKCQVAGLTPMGRMGKPDEVAAAVAFLAGYRASYITGQVLAVNGGMYM